MTLERERRAHDVRRGGERPDAPRVVDVDSPRGHARLARVPRFTDPADAVASGSLLAPMPGTVVRVAVEAGATRSAAGQAVLVLEAMKMQHTVSAPAAGTVTEIDVRARRAGRGRGGPGSRGGEAMTTHAFTESEERQELRRQVAKLAGKYGRDYFTEKARSGGKTTDLWLEIGQERLPRHQHPRGVRRRAAAASATSPRSARSSRRRAARCC